MNAIEVVSVTFGGKTFRAGRRTAAHLEWTQERLAARHPGARVCVIQPCYNTGVAASAGTHDFDAVLDVAIVGLDWWEGQRFLRESGWAGWYRHPPQFSEHHHMISLGYGDAPVGEFVPGQVADYHAHALGLKGQHNSGCDTSWFPADITATLFDYSAWLRDQEDDMQLTDDIYASPDRELSIGQLLRKLDAFIEREDARAKATKEHLAGLRRSVADVAHSVDVLPEGATKAQIKSMLEGLDVKFQVVVDAQDAPVGALA